jgi:anti-sigma factor RsiW
MTHHGLRDPHLEAGLVAAYVDGSVGTADAAKVEAHLALCSQCRQELIEVRRLLPVTARRWRWQAVAALAAAAVLLLMVGRPGGPRVSDRSSIRGGGHPEPLAPVLTPAEGARVRGGAVRFVWHSVPGSAAYRITLTDERGDVVWTTESADTSVTPATTIHVRGGHLYYWSVDVLLRDGRSTTTGFHSFRVAP